MTKFIYQLHCSEIKWCLFYISSQTVKPYDLNRYIGKETNLIFKLLCKQCVVNEITSGRAKFWFTMLTVVCEDSFTAHMSVLSSL